MNPADITVDQAIAALEKAVQIKGADYVYPNDWCIYKEDDNTPSCIVGYALSELGLLSKIGTDDGNADEVCQYLGLSFAVNDVFSAAQSAQDGTALYNGWKNRKTWGEALDLARRVAKDLGQNP